MDHLQLVTAHCTMTSVAARTETINWVDELRILGFLFPKTNQFNWTSHIDLPNSNYFVVFSFCTENSVFVRSIGT